jgi:hypothetical protein
LEKLGVREDGLRDEGGGDRQDGDRDAPREYQE